MQSLSRLDWASPFQTLYMGPLPDMCNKYTGFGEYLACQVRTGQGTVALDIHLPIKNKKQKTLDPIEIRLHGNSL